MMMDEEDMAMMMRYYLLRILCWWVIFSWAGFGLVIDCWLCPWASSSAWCSNSSLCHYQFCLVTELLWLTTWEKHTWKIYTCSWWCSIIAWEFVGVMIIIISLICPILIYEIWTWHAWIFKTFMLDLN